MALTDKHSNDSGVSFLDAAEYVGGSRYALAVGNIAGATRSSVSINCVETQDAQEVAIALALSNQGCATCPHRLAPSSTELWRRGYLNRSFLYPRARRPS
ncbi:hypothetical protein HPB48_017570 [Haemaphysalis longicornis]|uniref:Uncharacterized protein n=1 Tax=Haemaphysalis longicornis TaxID=44386 RepID=A0A9J6GJU6_HAELO|nr:hypothetical protein HPB48_017570 [Haemaphysalis longicornis]